MLARQSWACLKAKHGAGSRREQRNPKGGRDLSETEEAGSTAPGANQMKALRRGEGSRPAWASGGCQCHRPREGKGGRARGGWLGGGLQTELETRVGSARDGAVGCGFDRRALIRETESGAQEDRSPRGRASAVTFHLGGTFQSLPKLLKAGWNLGFPGRPLPSQRDSASGRG